MNLNFRRLLPVFAIATGVALVGVTSAFKEAPKSPAGPYFYQFVGDQTNETSVKSTSSYQRVDDGCSEDAGNLCGIYLQHDAAPNANPSSTDLSPHEDDLWTSAQNNATSEEGVIEMKNE